MKIETTDADFEAAFTRRFMGGAEAWQSVKDEARKIAAERLSQANRARQKEICALLPLRSGPEWMALQQEFDALVAEHSELLRIAFPGQFQEGAK
jgi:hypothetical protein